MTIATLLLAGTSEGIAWAYFVRRYGSCGSG